MLTEIIKNSFSLLAKEPKLFLPKFLLAALYGLMMYQTSSLILRSANLVSLPMEVLSGLLIEAFILLIASFALFILDSLINSMYIFLVKDHKTKKKIFFGQAFRKSLEKSRTVIPAVIIITLIIFVLVTPFSFLLSFYLLTGDIFILLVSMIAMGVLIFILDLLFFLIYPVSSLEKKNSIQSIRKTISLSKKNIRDVSRLSLFPFFVSILSWVIVFFTHIPELFLTFVFLRFLIAVISTYNYVLNPLYYLETKIHIYE